MRAYCWMIYYYYLKQKHIYIFNMKIHHIIYWNKPLFAWNLILMIVVTDLYAAPFDKVYK